MLDRRDLFRLMTRVTGWGLLLGGCASGRAVLEDDEHRSREPVARELPTPHVNIEEILEAYFENAPRGGIREIGAACVEELGENEARIREVLKAAMGLETESPTVEEALHAADDAVRADFENLRIRSIRGWQLAETEVRLFALVELLARRPGPTP